MAGEFSHSSGRRMAAVDDGIGVGIDPLPAGEMIEQTRGRALRLEQSPGDAIVVEQIGQWLADRVPRRDIPLQKSVGKEVGTAVDEERDAGRPQVPAKA